MQFQVTLRLLLVASAAIASPPPSPSSSPPPYSSPEPPRAGYYSTSQRPLYTAQRVRDYAPATEDDEPYPSTSTLGTAQTTHGALEPENTGFVEPIDFKSLLRDVESSSKGLELSASSANPLFAQESRNSFSGFFNSDNKDPFAEFNGGRLATASSERSNTRGNNNDESGFVDPNVQFRSLFDSAQTASNGFKPEDFLSNQERSASTNRDDSVRAYPSYTYTGRREDGEPNRYRSSYRQVDTSDDDYNDRDRYNNEDDRDYYGSPVSRGPAAAAAPEDDEEEERPRPRNNPATEASANRPQSTARSPKSAESNSKAGPKCKKVEKTVDYENDDYASFIEPEEGYDPSSYSGRYKRQTRNGRQAQKKQQSKRPMTCYVCEDEQGRYAERCSYDSNGSPKKGEYFHSSSSSFSDNGRGKSGDRHRRNPYVSRKRLEAAPTTLASVSVPAPTTLKSEAKKTPEIEQSEPKVVEKRQSGPGRYASRYGPAGQDNNNNNNNNRQRGNNYGGDDFDYQSPGGDFDLPRGYIGNNGGQPDTFDNPQGRAEDRQGQGGDFGFGGGRNNNGNGNDRDFGGFGGGRDNDFNFGPPSDFGRDSSSNNPGGFNFDFSIPREYDPDIQLRDGNNRNGPQGSPSNTEDYPSNFDREYDDYVKRNFPDDSGPSRRPGPDSSTRGPSPSFQPSSGPPVNHSPPSYRPRPHNPTREHSFNQNQFAHSPPGPQYNHRNPDKEHTQPSHNFAPPPNFFNDGQGGGFGGDGEGVQHSQQLGKLVEDFQRSDRGRDGCQRVQKGDMSCYVCRDARGMNKEECMYASNDPNNQKMAYHEVTEYSSPGASVLPVPNNKVQGHANSQASASAISSKTVASPAVASDSDKSKDNVPSKKSNSPNKSKSITRVESMVITRKVHHENKSPIEYDFDY